MNTNALKKFAQEARTKLVSQVGAKLEYVLTSDSAELREKAKQVKKLQELINRTSKEQVIDKVAYTWFNRLMALRFMDANDYQPLGIRIITPKDGYTLPELLDEAKQGNISEELPVKHQHVYDVLDGKIASSNPQNEAYKELLIGACNHLNKVLPFLFEKIDDYAELLLPDDLISEFSIVEDMRKGMTIDDCHEVEIIGWLYQFYISEKKDEVFASKSKVKKEDIPAATQLFTPRWIVEYMVQNTVGKLWLQNNPKSKLKEHMPYYIESPSIESEDSLKVSSVEEITLLDQACGSGHILVYGFELFTKIYEEEGYNSNEIPQLIIEKNLFGFEIDERAAQLAGMALMMKARSYQRRVFRKKLKPNILCYQDLQLSTDEIIDSLTRINIAPSDELLFDLNNMRQATNLGSLIIPHSNISEIKKTLEKVSKEEIQSNDAFLKLNLKLIDVALRTLKKLATKYHCIADNPPYMGGNMNKELGSYVKVNYPDSKADLMTCFMEAGWNALHPKGILGMINLPSWLFLSSFERLRKKLIKEKHIDSLLHMGRGIFGVDWGSTAFIIQNQKIEKESKCFKLHKRNFQHLYPQDIRQIFLKAKNNPSTKINFDKYREGNGITSVDELVDNNGLQIFYLAKQKDFGKIPGSPIGYWLSENWKSIFNISTISKKAISDGQNITGNNEKYIRFHWEVDFNEISKNSNWPLTAKGGSFRRWSGNIYEVVSWSPKSIEEYKKNKIARIQSEKLWFRKGITWNLISSTGTGFRVLNENQLFNKAAPTILFETEDEKYINGLLGFLNTKISTEILKILNPTFNTNIREVLSMPFKFHQDMQIDKIVDECIEISDLDWNKSENSNSFKKNEFIRINGQSLEESFDLYQQYWKNKFFQLHKNEEVLNKHFIINYDLQDELTPDVSLGNITILKDETSIEKGQLVFHSDEIIIQFISYAVGCLFGRYSLDKEGFILASHGETLEDYLIKVKKTEGEIKFLPDDDNIIPILDDEWFEDDIVGRFYEFLKITFGKENFDKNLAFVEECLGKDIRKFFVKDFYNDHIKRYKKRPIYWMFSSPKGSFNVLIYMHRYTPDALNQILNDYLKEYREKLNTRMEHLNHLIESGSSQEQTQAAREKDKLAVVLLELQEYEREVLYPLATERITIDLDDGVLVNYNKFGTAIKEVKGLSDKKTKEKVRKFDWIDSEEII